MEATMETDSFLGQETTYKRLYLGTRGIVNQAFLAQLQSQSSTTTSWPTYQQPRMEVEYTDRTEVGLSMESLLQIINAVCRRIIL